MDYSSLDTVARDCYSNTCKDKIQYGTAGFRTKAERLNHIMYRMGILAALRSKFCGAAVGLMITASHNEECDNGVKIVDPAGNMLESTWEKIADNFGNLADDDLIPTLKEILKEYEIDQNAKALVIVGRDTRESGNTLSNAAICGIKGSNGCATDVGVVTTPQLHYLVVCTNSKRCKLPTTEDYISMLSNAFKANKGSEKKKNYVNELYLDAANGVGAIAAKALSRSFTSILTINIFNDGSGSLNYNCGADYVKIHQVPPLNSPTEPNYKCVSIDGDADRVIYYYIDENKKFHLLDGDKIACLILSYVKELITASGLSVQVGLVQTAYANGASTLYASEVLKVPVAFTNTGVKYLHHRAQEFDIGVYFEANGHGTVLFKDETMKKIRAATVDQNITEKNRSASKKLSDLIDMINQCVGDALGDMLVIETILYEKDWNIKTWERIYDDLPNKQVKVIVKDRNVIQTTDAERRCTSPSELQHSIDDIVARYPKGRSFVRPSGTEDFVRVYAECEDADEVNKLVAEVALIVYQLAGGVGPEPAVSK